MRDGRRDWRCRAGARYFHVCEDGLVHYCSSRHGSPGIPLADYGPGDLARAFDRPKPCAATCTQAYAHQISRMDARRSQSGAPIAAGEDPGLIPVAALVRGRHEAARRACWVR